MLLFKGYRNDQYAAGYAQSVQAYDSYAAENLFCLSFEFIQPNEKLDLH